MNHISVPKDFSQVQGGPKKEEDRTEPWPGEPHPPARSASAADAAGGPTSQSRCCGSHGSSHMWPRQCRSQLWPCTHRAFGKAVDAPGSQCSRRPCALSLAGVQRKRPCAPSLAGVQAPPVWRTSGSEAGECFDKNLSPLRIRQAFEAISLSHDPENPKGVGPDMQLILGPRFLGVLRKIPSQLAIAHPRAWIPTAGSDSNPKDLLQHRPNLTPLPTPFQLWTPVEKASPEGGCRGKSG